MHNPLIVPRPFYALAALLVTAAGTAFADSVLTNEPTLMTTTSTYLSRTTSQNCLPLWWNRGTDLEGGIRFGGDVPASPGFNSGMGAATMGGIDLASLGFSMAETDMALPTNGPAVVIGRSFNHRQGSDTTVAASNGLQGYNWFQSAMPEISVYKGGGANDDIVYMVYGANRFIEFKETSTTGKFRGGNGATGIVVRTAGGGGNYETYTLTDQNGWQWVFWGDTSTKADFQLWKKIDPQGLTVYAGDKSNHASAVSNGYASNGGFSTVYQEFGDPSSPTERRYTFSYTSVSSKNRLTEVKAEIKSGGTWASPSGLTEIGRVSYAYYTASTANAVDTNDFYGNAADLKTVKVRTPLTDSGTDLSSGIYDERTKYYRYYDTYDSSPGRRGHPHTIKLVLGFEGARRFDWGDNATFDDSFNNTTVYEETTALKPYSDAFYEYESSSSTQRIATAFFNGECGCTGGGSDGTYAFTYDASSNAGTYRTNGSYDNSWCTRTIVDQPDSTDQVRYFDELGQPLSTVITTNTGGSTHWVTGVDRDSSGRVTTIHSPANLSTYTHSTGAITYSSSVGLITSFDRYTSGEPSYDSDLDGLLAGSTFKEGTSGTASYTSKTVLSARSLSVSSLALTRPLITESRAFHTATSSYGTGGTYDATTYTFAWWSGTNTSPLYVTPKSVTTTLPAVVTGHNGANTTHDAVSYLRKDGRTAFSVATDGIYTAMKYNTVGLPVRTIRDADPSTSGDFDSGYGPGDYSLSTSSNGGLKYATEATYDNIGRTVTSIARPDSSTPIKRIAETYYGRLSDHRLATISFPEQKVVSSTLTYYGPAGYSVSNQAGKGEFACTLGIATTTAAKADWLNESYEDPIYALENASANLGGSSRANIFGISTSLYNYSGVKVSESRSYTNFATSSTWTGSSGTNYDRTEYSYDVMGRVDRVKDPTDTITRTMFDDLGRASSRWVGSSDTSWPPVASSSAAGDMTQTELTTYDTNGVGNSLVTKRTAYVAGDTYGFGSTTDQRETSFIYDVRGRAIVTNPPLPPSTVVAYDLRSRVTASAQYSNSTGLTAATDPAAAGSVSYRTALSKTFYDARSQVYESRRFKVDQSTGAFLQTGGGADDPVGYLESTTWRDAAGRVVKQGGTSNSKTVYDRLGRAVHQYTLARNNDSAYADADDVSGDIVLEQSDTVYDDADKTGLVMMTATMMRNYDDTSTTGALDTNADNNVYKYTQTGTPDVKGRIQITAYWYDELDRQQDVVQYGTYNYADFDRRPSSAWLTVPSRSATALRTTTVYNNNGTVQARQDPKIRTGSTPYETLWLYDQAMRKTAEIRNHTGAGAAGNYTTSLSPAERDTDVYTRYTYSAGRMATVWVDFDGDGTVDTGDQVTTYSYNVTKGASTGQSAIKDKRLLDSVLYPAQGFSGETTADRTVAFAYNAQGQKTYQLDGNGTVMEYLYDANGRKTVEKATTIPGTVDGTVKRVETAFDGRGMLSTVTQFDATSSGDETDQVLYKYDDWGNLTDFRQDNDDVVTNSSPNDYDVYYTYSKVDTTSPTSGTRRSGLRRTAAGLSYGAGATGSGTQKYEVAYTYTNSDYGTTLYDDDYGRVTRMTRSYPTSAVLLSLLRYGGTGIRVQNYLPESGVNNIKATGGTSGWDVAFDRFGRETRSLWKNGSSNAIYYDGRPAYDENSNTTAVENAWVTPWSSTYESDGLNRLKGLKFGVMTTGSISTVVQQEDWQTGGTLKLDQVGNWVDYKRTRESAAQDDWLANTFTGINAYRKIDRVSGADWEPEYTAKGLAKKDDKTGGTTKGYQYTFDAWDRLVTVKSTSGAVVEEFRYNGLGHRIGWHYDVNADLVVDGDDRWFYFQFNERWQQVAMYYYTNSSPGEVFTYLAAGADGYGGSSYIDDCLMRERDTNANGDLDERLYYLQNWRHDVVALMTYDGAIKERLTYDAYGRPHAFSPGDLITKISGTPYDRPSGTLDADDTWTTGSVVWNKDLGNSSGVAIPDGAVTADDDKTLTNLKAAGYSAGYGILSDAGVGNRKGYAGYEFDNILQGNGGADTKPVYHVRHRVLAADTGKWFQKDPLGYHDSMDLYEYCASDPEDRRDPTGLATALNSGPLSSGSPRQCPPGFYYDETTDTCRSPIGPLPRLPWDVDPARGPRPEYDLDACLNDPSVVRALQYANDLCAKKSSPCRDIKIEYKRGSIGSSCGLTSCSTCTISISADCAYRNGSTPCAVLVNELINMGDLCATGCRTTGNVNTDCAIHLRSEARSMFFECCTRNPGDEKAAYECARNMFDAYWLTAVGSVCSGVSKQNGANIWIQTLRGLKCGNIPPINTGDPSDQPWWNGKACATGACR